MQAYQENISAKVSGVLSPVLGVQITVTDTVTGNLAALYSDNGVTPIAQPLVTDETGYFGFYAANGTYSVSFSSPQIKLDPRTVKLYDPNDDQPLTQAQAAAPTGASGVGYGQRTVANKLDDIVHVRDFGAKLDNSTDDLPALNAAIAHLRALGGGTLDFGSSNLNNCRISAPWRLCNNLTVKGNARILPTPGFSSAGVVLPTYSTEAPQTYSCLAYFNDGTHADDPTNFGYGGLKIAETITFDGQYHAQVANGLIFEGMTDYKIDAAFTQFNSIGVWAKYNCWGGSIRSYITSCGAAFLKLGPAANGIDMNGLKCYGLAQTPTYSMIIDGDNNGLNLSGAFFEHVVNHILWVGGSGPSTISGVDFEVCSGTVVHVDGTGVTGRAAGPVTITGSFLEAGTCAVKATNAIVYVVGCRIRSTPLAFKSIGGAARIYDIANTLESTVVKRSEGHVISDCVNADQRMMINHLPYGDVPYRTGYMIDNHFYSYNEDLTVSGLSFDSSIQDTSSQRMLTSSTWQTSEMRNGAVYDSMGLTLNYKTGAKNIEPVSTGHSLGTAAKPFDTVYGKTIMFAAGVAVGVNPVNNGEFTLQFTSNTQLTIKAKGTDGVVRIANLTLA